MFVAPARFSIHDMTLRERSADTMSSVAAGIPVVRLMT
jgi:hypothetical protein